MATKTDDGYLRYSQIQMHTTSQVDKGKNFRRILCSLFCNMTFWPQWGLLQVLIQNSSINSVCHVTTINHFRMYPTCSHVLVLALLPLLPRLLDNDQRYATSQDHCLQAEANLSLLWKKKQQLLKLVSSGGRRVGCGAYWGRLRQWDSLTVEKCVCVCVWVGGCMRVWSISCVRTYAVNLIGCTL